MPPTLAIGEASVNGGSRARMTCRSALRLAGAATLPVLITLASAAAEAVLGHSHMTGRLPISIPGFYAYGHRVEDRMAGASAKP